MAASWWDEARLTVSGLDPTLFEVELCRGAAGTEAGGVRVTVGITHRGVVPVEARLRVSATLADADDPYWLIPGLFYGENRPAGNERLYPRFARAADEPADPGRFVSPAWSFRADRAATPVVFAWGASAGLALAVDERSTLGLTGLGFSHDGDTARLHADFPAVEAPVSYVGGPQPAVALAETHRWQPGERHEVELCLYQLPADRHSYPPVLRERHARYAAEPPRPWVDVAQAAELAAYGLHRWHFRPEPAVLLETAAFDREFNDNVRGQGDREAMHVAWISGIPYAYALLAHGRRRGDGEYVAAGTAVIDHVCANLAPAGTFWGQWTAAHGWGQSWTPVDGGLHARTLGEATLFLHRADRAERAAGVEHPDWLAATRSNLDVAVRGQRADGNFGGLLHAEDGRVLSWLGSAGLTWVAALAEAHDLDPGYLPAARRGGEYYARFVREEFLHGAPEDVDLAPTSEDGYAAIMAYLALWRATGEEHWLALARHAADWMLTFRYSYNVHFAEHTLLGAYGFRSRGADQASPSNQHLHAYGLICLPEMVELAAATGDRYYLDRTRENLACFRQFIARADGDFNAYRGMASERYYQTACFQAKGMLLTLSHAWSVGVLLLGCEAALSIPQADWDPPSRRRRGPGR
ncbi:hypothetical protein [Plantactinospora endophytica]|uniref:Uncharacterized protein n=1 Tax=Plantactinospora endophytica TaxID=673535 RepID=A0ABQ4E7M3_9ACTN|nr:hypothetical protein [Plantactinospora endophytica]GIG90720.1 hypothetical protein Pen02_56560 [Plantactinospora endophytica]